MNKLTIFFLKITAVLVCITACSDKAKEDTADADYRVYGGNKAGNRYSQLKQINLEMSGT